ncbi:hypothetical protein LNTAR_12156 [Lentisphaera araneosa HTCC2155]|uniref:Uncharacterized protein n=1 Tax=Lentisphaera araneosa HTCC2155 TaxID=313628 RepID=A6DJN2_9BACT|nr:hypothetical protein LNTAR_12156 [Lentisphaera araneosa HTCC2155]
MNAWANGKTEWNSNEGTCFNYSDHDYDDGIYVFGRNECSG